MFNATMDFGLGEDIDALRETVRRFALEEIAPKSAEVDRSNDFPMELWEMIIPLAPRKIIMPQICPNGSMTQRKQNGILNKQV